jgi:hypothetical protein
MAIQNNLRYMCGQFHVVTIYFVYTPEHVPPVVEHFTGMQSGVEQERSIQYSWPDESFQRDDIEAIHADAQRGFKRLEIGGVVRRAFESFMGLVSINGRVRIVTGDSDTDPYFVGFANTLKQAACWVATGKPKLFVPWEKL